jgi:copper oxidase (laccase) domain-containing protein
LRHPLLVERGIDHGFGVRGGVPPEDLRRARQVHGARIVCERECAGPSPPEADGIVSASPGVPVAVFTADCVPILLATAALLDLVGGAPPLVAVIGPHVGACCYEVDGPVLDALGGRFGPALRDCTRATRAGHAALDLAALARAALVAGGLAPELVGALPGACTRCDPERFHSYRRDGPAAGRLVHYIAAGSDEA